MKKIKRLVVGGMVLVVLILTSGVIWIDSVAKIGIETGSSFALGVDTKLDSADIDGYDNNVDASSPAIARSRSTRAAATRS